MTFKSIIKAITPPILWSVARRLRGDALQPSSERPAEVRQDRIALGYVRALEARFPKLSALGLTATPENASGLIDFYAEIISGMHPAALATHLRNALHRLGNRCNDPAIQSAIRRQIAVTELIVNHCPDRATALRNDLEFGPLLKAELDQMERAYGAPLISAPWPNADRGAALIYYFSSHPDTLRGKKILHMAAEDNLKRWISEKAGAASYRTSDAYGCDADEAQDITAMTLPDDSFDVVICHRVMEHVLDDAKGFSELFRILKPGGVVSFSVPQAPHIPSTAEWAIPDLTHHGHVRHYGADLEHRMESAGFRVELMTWLLTHDHDALRAKNAYPMRIYHLYK
jgi:SAM-dependent methyltransferase